MTKREFIENAALMYLSRRPSTSAAYIVNKVTQLADALYPDDDNDKQICEDRSIERIAKEIDMRDKKDAARGIIKRADGVCVHKASKSGFAATFRRRTSNEGMLTLDDMLKMGSFEFSRLPGIGPKLMIELNYVLMELYGIRSW